MRTVRPTQSPPTHDVVLLNGDGTLAAYATGVQNGTSLGAPPLTSGGSAGVRASRSVRPEQLGGATSGGGPVVTPITPTTEPPAPGSERPPSPSATDREAIRSSAAKLGYLPPATIEEATYPAAWFAPSEVGRLGGAVR